MFPKLPKQDKTRRRPSPVASHTHDPETGTLSVTFHHGKTYTYPGVPNEIAAGLEDCESKGSYLMKHVIGTYPHTC